MVNSLWRRLQPRPSVPLATAAKVRRPNKKFLDGGRVTARASDLTRSGRTSGLFEGRRRSVASFAPAGLRALLRPPPQWYRRTTRDYLTVTATAAPLDSVHPHSGPLSRRRRWKLNAG